MGKVMLGIWTEKNISLSRTIKACMQRTGVKKDKLILKAMISTPTFYTHLKDPEKITIRELRAYITELNIPKEDILDALYLKEDGSR